MNDDEGTLFLPFEQRASYHPTIATKEFKKPAHHPCAWTIEPGREGRERRLEVSH
jgi:hypothetical protein